MLLFKAIIPGGAARSLFAMPTAVDGYVRDGKFVAPHIAIRHKAADIEARLARLKQRRDPDGREPDLFSVATPPAPPSPSPSPAAEPQPAPGQETAADKIRRIVGLDATRIAAYDPEKAVKKIGGRWEYETVHGTGAGLFGTRREAMEAATNHITLKRDQLENPTRYFDIVSLLARQRLALIERYMGQGMTEMDAGRRANAEIPDHVEPPADHIADTTKMVPEQSAPAPATGGNGDAIAAEAAAESARRAAQAGKLRDLADKDAAAAEADMSRDRNANTARRARMAASATETARARLLIAETMKNLADAIEFGETKHLSGITSRAAVETLDEALRQAKYARNRSIGGEAWDRVREAPITPDDIRFARIPESGLSNHDARYLLEAATQLGVSGHAAAKRWLATASARDNWAVPSDDTLTDLRAFAAALAPKVSKAVGSSDYRVRNAASSARGGMDRIRSISAGRSRFAKMGIATDLDLQRALAEYMIYRAGAKTEDPIKRMERELVGEKPGIDFFPTPAPLVDQMVMEADVRPGMRVLEPSAGKGDIADAARAAGAVVDVVEISHTLQAILRAKGHNVVASDFEGFDPPAGGYDRIIMNPPFSKGMDADHVRRAYDMLAPGGRLVAITGEGIHFRSDAKAEAFRSWLEERGGEATKLPEGSFKSAFRPTGVATRLVVIDKPDDAAPIRGAEPPAPAPEPGPREGDTKVEDGTTYVLRDGRWHRAEPEAKAEAPAPAQPTLAAALESFGGEPFSLADAAARWSGGDTEALADQLHARPDDFALLPDGRWQRMADYLARPDAAEEIARLGEAIDGGEGDQRPRWKRQLRALADAIADQAPTSVESTPPPSDQPKSGGGASEAQAESESTRDAAGGDDLDPTSPNYRYRDTGYIAGSRKEMAAESIRRAARAGLRVRTTDVDWKEIEANPREAAALITKANVFGNVDWQAMRDAGIDPGAGFLLSRIYAAVAPAPTEDSPGGRRAFTMGIDSLRDRLERCKTVADVAGVLTEIRDERDGVTLNAEEQAAYQTLTAAMTAEGEKVRALDARADLLTKEHTAASTIASKLGWDLDKRRGRKWKVDPADDARLAELKAAAEEARARTVAFREENGMNSTTERLPNGGMKFHYAYRKKYEAMGQIRRAFMEGVVARNRAENAMFTAWRALGDGFTAIVDHRTSRGSQAFANHMATAKAGRIRDWDWAEKKREVRAATQQSVRFQLRVADRHERVGGRDIGVSSTPALKATFGLRDVQSGHWVLEDPNSAKFHVESAAAAFADLADLLGVPDTQVAMGGRLAMAFGARGRGASMRTGDAPAAHYEPIQRVINITKMSGGGSLAHEWFHFLDNLLPEVSGGGDSTAETFGTEALQRLAPAVRAPMAALVAAMNEGPHVPTQPVPYTEAETRWAESNMTGTYGTIRQAIRSAPTMAAALAAIDTMHDAGQLGRVGTVKAKRARGDWRKIAMIHHAERERAAAGLPADAPRIANLVLGGPRSSFAREAERLDRGDTGKYWSTPKEMAARAFAAWVEDRLEAQGRVNTYLTSMTNNADYVAAGMPPPYPEGEERERINSAIDGLVAALRADGTLAKALALMAA